MKDFPIFTTQYGVASLTLKEIPYSGNAYIMIQDSQDPKRLLEECVDFCCVAGAKTVIASGNNCLNAYPLHTTVILMRCLREQLADTDAALFPVQLETMERFKEIYNHSMKAVPNASYMTDSDCRQVLNNGNGYFVRRGETFLGIGIAGGERIDAIASVIPGCGKDVLLALNYALSGTFAEVEVATANLRAIRFYEKMGFTQCAELSRWYKII